MADDVNWVRLCAPAWWCTTCEAWWPGGWGPVYVGELPDPAQLARDLDDYHHLIHRTCAECGTELVPRPRTVAVVELRGGEL